ncbi:MAG: DUF6055 domain-containing protein [Tannerellaceae bacterium]|nr:DUF6055 domain-containing protein [Tannerellaceae bacterium]
MRKNIFLLAFLLFISSTLFVGGCTGCSDTSGPQEEEQKDDEEEDDGIDTKEIYFPKGAWNVEGTNDYQNPDSQFSVHRMAETKNLVVFWEKGFGDHPSTCANPDYRIDLDDIMKETDKMYCFYRDQLKFVEKGNSLTDKYKMIMFLYYNDDGTVYGGGVDDTIGAMWISPGRVKSAPYGAMAHELGHFFQFMVNIDGGWGYSGEYTIFEMTSQYMLWQYYPTWIQFENYHLDTFMENTHKAFLHEVNCYSSPFVLEYWAHKHGIDFIGRLWRESEKGEDPVITYKRINGMDQDAFNLEMYQAVTRFINWDMERIREVSRQYANRHISQLVATQNGWYRVPAEKCPENYGYNAIQLELPAAGSTVKIRFKGLENQNGYTSVNPENAGWHYGIVASSKDGKHDYSKVYTSSEDRIEYVVPEGTSHLWFVVMGAPAEHVKHVPGQQGDQWPYEIRVEGTTIHSSVLQ